MTAGEAYHTLANITTVINQVLNDVGWFLFLAQEAAELYVAPLEGWLPVIASFPSIIGDSQAASECIALEQYTAAVFLLMRVLERGLRALATSLSIPTVRQDVGTWGDLLREIKMASEAATAAMPKRSPARKAEEEYYGALLAEFRHFKDAWRDRVAHSNRTYDQDDAKQVLRHVQSFMLGLAPRLHE